MSMFGRAYTTLPPIPQSGVLERYAEQLGMIVPVARTNLILNPSLETNTTGYTALGGSIARSTAQQYHGAYSLAITPSAATTDGAYYGTVSLTSGVTYAVSCKVLGAAGVPYKLSVATTGGADLVSRAFVGTGRWQWVWLFWTETSTTTRRIYLTKNTSTNTSVFYLDGLQVEACGSEGVFVTTYIDGDQQGYVANQNPPAYLWSGTRHASTSSRSGQTRAGGRIVKFRDLGFLLTALIGLGLATPRNELLGFAQLDGAQYRNVIKAQRSFSLVGRFQGADPTAMDVSSGQVGQLLDRDRIGLRQELALCLQAQECNADIGEPLIIPRAVYASGLDGNTVDLPVSSVNITFSQYLPYVVGRDAGVALDVQDAITPNDIAVRSPSGVWSVLGSGLSGGTTVNAIVRGLDGTIYVGGIFTDAGGSGADYLAAYSPATATWSVVGSATALNSTVNALVIGPDGALYVGGNFTNASGIANADYIAKWNGSAWSALSTGMNNEVNALAFSPTGTLYAGGNFTTAGGGAAVRVASWNGSVWSAMGTGANARVRALVWGNNQLYIGGGFTTGGGVSGADYIASWNGAWAALSTGADGDVYSLAIGPNGQLYASGTFQVIGGVTAGGIASWNGVSWSAIGLGFSSPGSDYATGLAVSSTNILYLATNNEVADPGNAEGIISWNGASYITLGLAPTSATAILLTPDGTLYAGVSSAETIAGSATATNTGSAATYPTLTLTGPSTGSARIYEMVNTTTGIGVYFNYTMLPGEVATFILDPANLSFTSTFQGNVYSTVLPGSQPAQFALQPGANTITFLSGGSTVTATLSWSTHYLSPNDALYAAVAP